MSVTIIRQPISKNVLDGDIVIFSIEATGTNLRYQWFRNSLEEPYVFEEIPGAISSFYSFAASMDMNGCIFNCWVEDDDDYAHSRDVYLTVRRNEYVMQYEIDDDVYDLPVSGWLPHDTKRNNLYQLLLATGVTILNTPDGNSRFTYLRANNEPDRIEDSKIFLSGDVKYERPYASVTVSEHTYTSLLDADRVTLFDNSDEPPAYSDDEWYDIDDEIQPYSEIWFSQAPVIVSTLQATDGLVLHSATENSAVISGNGKLTGIPYTHTINTVTRSNPNGEKEKTASITNCTMVSTVNSDNLLRRLYAYYCPRNYIKTIRNEIKYTSEQCGKSYEFSNPFKEQENAFLAKIDNRASSFNRASCEFRAGYIPPGIKGLYKNCIILDAETYAQDSGTIILPDEIFSQESPQIKVVLISGGNGGSSGWPGKNGRDTYTHTSVSADADISGMWYGGEGGDGGFGGSGGDPGRVLTVTIKNPNRQYSYTIGQGGEGGAATGFIPDTEQELRNSLGSAESEYSDSEINSMLAQEAELTNWNGRPNQGSAGTDTTFGNYTTASRDAFVPSGGVYNPITNEYYALKGNIGINGGKGGARKVRSGDTFTWVTDGEDVIDLDGTVYYGGRTGEPLTYVDGLSEAPVTIYGGNGAGAAVGISREEINQITEELVFPHINGQNDQTTSWEVTEDGV